MGELYIGLMSGTSLDGVDAALVEFPGSDAVASLRSLGHVHLPMPDTLRQVLMALNRSGADEIHHAALAANALMRLYAESVHTVLARAQVPPERVRALGAHGQTVRHRPTEFDGTGYTVQLMNGALLAELTGIDTVCDFRTRDLAAGGQGAPLAPAFHAHFLAEPGQTTAVLNVGGMANLSVISPDGTVVGFDTGPGNALMDLWHARHRQGAYDADGQWAASGQALQPLLAAMGDEPYFHAPPPKSTGRDLFNEEWLMRLLGRHAAHAAPADVMATLTELTACSVAQALRRHAPAAHALWVCGGGAANGHLMRRLAAHAAGVQVDRTAARGMPVDQVEALAFAWLAHAFMHRLPGNLPRVTGAKGPRVLGALYPA